MTFSKLNKLTIAALCTFALTISADIGLNAYRITSADGLPSNTVNDLWQDNNGYLWVATKSDVCRYDGYSFVSFYRHGNAGKLIGDTAHGTLWISYATYNYRAIDLKTFRYLSYEQADSATSYNKSVLGKNGLWVYDNDHGARFIYRDGAHLRFNDYNATNHKLAGNSVKMIRLTNDGKAWMSTTNGIYVVDTLGNIRCLDSKASSHYVTPAGSNVCFLDDAQRILVYSAKGKKVGSASLLGSGINAAKIRDMFFWNDKVIMLAANGTYSLNPISKNISKVEGANIASGLLLEHTDGFYFVQGDDYSLWIFDDKGKISRLHLVTDIKFTHSHKRIYAVRRMHDGRFAIATYGNGLYFYDNATGALEHHTADDADKLISTNYLEKLFIDRQGSLWIGESLTGLSFISSSQGPSITFSYAGTGNRDDWSNNISMLQPTPNGDAMVGTRDNKLYRLDGKSHQMTFVRELKAPAYCFYEDKNGHQWLGTRGDGLYVDGVRYAPDEKVNKCFSNDFYCIKEDRKGNVWIGTPNSGLLQTHYEKGKTLKFKQYLKRNFNESFIPCLDVDKNGTLWVSTTNGLYRLDNKVKEVKDESFDIYNTSKKNFPYDDVVLVKCTDDGYVWTGTNGGGLQRNKLSADGSRFDTETITQREGLANNTVSDIVDTHDGNLWVATDYGLSIVKAKDLKAFTYPLSKETTQNIIVNRCASMLSDKSIAFGTLYGVVLVNTKMRQRADNNSTPMVTDILVNGKSILNEDTKYLFADGIRLSHNDNSLTFNFSNFDFSAHRHNLYQYYLEGLEKSWRDPASTNSVEYGNLPPGHYTLHVRALSRDNQWGKETTISVVIRQPWYNTWWAWLIYIVIIATAAYYVWRNWKQKFDLRQSVKMEKQLTEFRLNFFTHITHEFRTPLAIIQGAVDKLTSADGNVSKANVQTAKRGVRRLLRLVNQLLEFRRISTKKIRLEVEKGDIIDFVRDIYQDFWSVAKQKEQNITFMPFERSYEMLFDKRIVETVVYNLLSNAVKYTPVKGNIALKTRLEHNTLCIICEDSGPGISPEQQKELFRPFMHGYVSQGGMGIGLYNAHEMAVRHHGNLQYASASPNGSVFTFTLPLDDSVYSVDEYKSNLAINAETKEEKEAEIVIHELKPEALNDIRIAIIEDDPDMMMQLKTEMSTYFHIDAYMDGKTGYDGVLANRPALLVCDVMLPDMNGYDIVRKLKKSDDFYDIPVIMLTALDDDKNKLKGYEAGADDYIVKPCNFKLLIARTVQLINWYKKMKASVKGDESQEQKPLKKVETVIVKPGGEEEKIITSIADRNFITKVQTIVSQHIGDNDFTIDDLASMMNMGRTKFYGKIKDLLGMSPNKYLNRERMRIAGELVLEGELTIAEIGYRVGINDPTYFNKCFKSYYGCTPGKYRKQED